MDKQIILSKILNNEELKAKYWPEIDPKAENLVTLLRSKNKHLKVLHSLLNTTSNSVRMNEILTFFKI